MFVDINQRDINDFGCCLKCWGLAIGCKPIPAVCNGTNSNDAMGGSGGSDETNEVNGDDNMGGSAGDDDRYGGSGNDMMVAVREITSWLVKALTEGVNWSR